MKYIRNVTYGKQQLNWAFKYILFCFKSLRNSNFTRLCLYSRYNWISISSYSTRPSRLNFMYRYIVIYFQKLSQNFAFKQIQLPIGTLNGKNKSEMLKYFLLLTIRPIKGRRNQKVKYAFIKIYWIMNGKMGKYVEYLMMKVCQRMLIKINFVLKIILSRTFSAMGVVEAWSEAERKVKIRER